MSSTTVAIDSLLSAMADSRSAMCPFNVLISSSAVSISFSQYAFLLSSSFCSLPSNATISSRAVRCSCGNLFHPQFHAAGYCGVLVQLVLELLQMNQKAEEGQKRWGVLPGKALKHHLHSTS